MSTILPPPQHPGALRGGTTRPAAISLPGDREPPIRWPARTPPWPVRERAKGDWLVLGHRGRSPVPRSCWRLCGSPVCFRADLLRVYVCTGLVPLAQGWWLTRWDAHTQNKPSGWAEHRGRVLVRLGEEGATKIIRRR